MTIMAGPAVRKSGARDAVRGVVLVLHGGQEHSKAKAGRLLPAYLRMVPFTRELGRAGEPHGIAVWLLCNRYRGWNEPDLDPVADARWALDKIRRTYPDVPVALVGHSMGARVALRVAGDAGVIAVCALAPWTTEADPVDQLAGKALLIVHGDRDRTTYPADSLAYALRAKAVSDTVCRFELRGDGHAMLRRSRDWTALMRRFVLGALESDPAPAAITDAMARPAPAGLNVRL